MERETREKREMEERMKEEREKKKEREREIHLSFHHYYLGAQKGRQIIPLL